MKFTSLAACALAVLVSACVTPPTPTAAPATQKVAEALEALRAGGYVMVVRHGTTDPDEADVDPLHLENCSKQRNLTDIGRLNASGIGKILARANVPVTNVRSSRFCRAIETAERISEQAHGGPVTATDDFSEAGPVVSPKESARRNQAMRVAVAAPPPAGTNSLIVSHRPNIMEAFGPSLFDVGEAEMVVFKPVEGTPGYELKWRIKITEFSAYNNAKRKESQVAHSE